MTLEAMILVGGLGTRLQGVVKDRPKPMAPVQGRPFVEWVLLSLRKQGITRLHFCTGYLSECIESYFGDGSPWGVKIRYSKDPFPLGTGGAVRHAADYVEEEYFLVVNGDSFCAVDVDRLGEFHREREAVATLWLVPFDDCSRFGSVTVDEEGEIHSFAEKRPNAGPGLINTGVYLLQRDWVMTIATDRLVSLEKECFPLLIGQGLYGIRGEGPFIDIGVPETYAVADGFFAWETLL